MCMRPSDNTTTNRNLYGALKMHNVGRDIMDIGGQNGRAEHCRTGRKMNDGEEREGKEYNGQDND